MIFLPLRFYKCFTDHHKILFEMIAKEFNFTFEASDSFGALPKDLDMLIFYTIPRHNNALGDIGNIPDKTKVIQYCEDLHNAGVLAFYSKSFKRANRIIGPFAGAFRKRFPQYVDKFIHFKRFFASDERYTALPYNTKPIMKCLLTGAANDIDYPLRMIIKNALKTDKQLRGLMEVNWHTTYPPKLPGETAPVYGDAYAKRLNSYFCCVTSSSKNNYAVARYMEIPAAGSLLIANQIPDSDDAGLIPREHYIPITMVTAVTQIKEVLSNPTKYEHIRRQGMKFVRANYSVKNRFEQLKGIIQQELSNG